MQLKTEEILLQQIYFSHHTHNYIQYIIHVQVYIHVYSYITFYKMYCTVYVYIVLYTIIGLYTVHVYTVYKCMHVHVNTCITV